MTIGVNRVLEFELWARRLPKSHVGMTLIECRWVDHGNSTRTVSRINRSRFTSFAKTLLNRILLCVVVSNVQISNLLVYEPGGRSIGSYRIA